MIPNSIIATIEAEMIKAGFVMTYNPFANDLNGAFHWRLDGRLVTGNLLAYCYDDLFKKQFTKEVLCDVIEFIQDKHVNSILHRKVDNFIKQ
jgi:hypothetical protein